MEDWEDALIARCRRQAHIDRVKFNSILKEVIQMKVFIAMCSLLAFLSIPAWAIDSEYEILFANDQHQLTDASKHTLKEVGDALKANPANTARIEGNTSSPGTESYNMALGLKRANGAKNHLFNMENVSADRLSTVSFGETRLKNQNDVSDRLQAGNRRVRMVLSLAPQEAAPKAKQVGTVFGTVTDRTSGRFIRDLTAGNFDVFEDGRERQINGVTFEVETPGSDIALLLDLSGSMKTSLDDLQKAAKKFVDMKKPSDRILLIGFGGSVQTIHDLESDPDQLKGSIGRMSASGNTLLHDAIYASAERLGNQTNQPAERIMVLITDGVEQSGLLSSGSKHTLEEAISALVSNNVTVYSIGLGGNIDTSVVQQVADESGGWAYFKTGSSDLEEIYANISSGLAQGRYRITFQTDRDAKSRGKITVKSRIGAVTGLRVFE